MGGFLRIPVESRLLAVEQDVVVRGDGPQVVSDHDLHGVHARTQALHHRDDLVRVLVRLLLLVGQNHGWPGARRAARSGRR